MSLEIKKASESDINFLLRLRESTMKEHFQRAGISLSSSDNRSRLLSNFDCCYLIFWQGKKVGLVKYIEREQDIEILQFQILPEHQRKGIGKQVLGYIANIADTSKKDFILSVLKENPAKLFYERNGFKIVGEDEHEFDMKYTG